MKCYTTGCEKEARKGRHFCECCTKRKFRKKYPIRAAYLNLKSNAKRRGKEFTLTLEQFRTFYIKNNYGELKGTTAESMTIDRVRNEKGYTNDNIRPLQKSINVKRNFYSDEELMIMDTNDAPF